MSVLQCVIAALVAAAAFYFLSAVVEPWTIDVVCRELIKCD